LRRLNLSHNRITDPTPLESLGAIDALVINGNPISCDMVSKLVAVFGKGTVIADACTGPA